jgi:hypothetical protein
MIGARVISATFRPRRVVDAVAQAERRAMFRGAAYVRTTAKRSLGRRTKSGKPSAAGRPPRSQTGALRRGIRFKVDKRNRATIGPAKSVVGTSASAHEFGGKYRGRRYDRRPFMRPTLERSQDRIAALWAASLR